MKTIVTQKSLLALMVGTVLSFSCATAKAQFFDKTVKLSDYPDIKTLGLIHGDYVTVSTDGNDADSQAGYALDADLHDHDFYIGSVVITVDGGGKNYSDAVGVYIHNQNKHFFGNGADVNINAQGEKATGVLVVDGSQISGWSSWININNTADSQTIGLSVTNTTGELTSAVLGHMSEYYIDTTEQGEGDASEGKSVVIYVNNASVESTFETLLDLKTTATGSVIEAENSPYITPDGETAYGATTVNLGEESIITAEFLGEQTGQGIRAKDVGSNVIAENLTIDVTNGTGVQLLSGAHAELTKGSHIIIKGDNVGNGIYVTGFESLFDGSELNINMEGAGSVSALQAAQKGQIQVGSGSQIVAKYGSAILINESDENGSRIDFIGSQENRNHIDHQASNTASVAVAGKNNLIALADTTLSVGENTTNVTGLKADNQGRIDAKNVMLGMGQESIAAVAQNASIINFSGETQIISGHENSHSALYADGKSSQINVVGKATIVGNMQATAGAKLNLELSEGSHITGAINVDENHNSTADVNMATSSWTVTDNSSVRGLNLTDSIIDFGEVTDTNSSQPQVRALLTGNNFKTLTVDSLSGTGQFNMRTDIVNQTGDLLVVKNQATGEHVLNIANNGAENTTGYETVTVVKTGDNQAAFTLANDVELGGYTYKLRPVEGSPNDLELATGRELSSASEASTSFLNVGYLTNYIENQTLLQRLGDLRNNPTTDKSGAWLKGFGGKLSSFSGDEYAGYDVSYSGVQLGADTQIDTDLAGRMLFGFMAGYTHMNPSYAQGSGSGKNYTLGYYATYLADNGWYVDSVLKFNHMRNQFNVTDTAGAGVTGVAKTNGVSLSAEVGKRFWMDAVPQGFYLEPQLQLTYGHQTGDTVHASNGLRVDLDDYNSLLGRASLVAGYQLTGINPMNLYAKVGVVREMSAKTHYSFNGAPQQDYELDSNFFDAGVGVNLNFAKAHNIYAEFDYANGQKFDKKQFDLGYRYTF